MLIVQLAVIALVIIVALRNSYAIFKVNERIDYWRDAHMAAISAPPPQPEPEAICGCKHHKCFHTEDGCGHAYTQIKAEDSIVKQMLAVEFTCPCKGYMGPEHLPLVLP